jgi:hypothetical protein
MITIKEEVLLIGCNPDQMDDEEVMAIGVYNNYLTDELEAVCSNISLDVRNSGAIPFLKIVDAEIAEMEIGFNLSWAECSEHMLEWIEENPHATAEERDAEEEDFNESISEDMSYYNTAACVTRDTFYKHNYCFLTGLDVKEAPDAFGRRVVVYAEALCENSPFINLTSFMQSLKIN